MDDKTFGATRRFKGRSGSFWSIWPIQMFAGRKLGKFIQMLRTQRFGNGVFLVEPFAKINQLAAMGTKRTMWPVEPGACLPADRTFDVRQRVHGCWVQKIRTKWHGVQRASGRSATQWNRVRNHNDGPVVWPGESRHACWTRSPSPGRQCRKLCRDRATCE